MRVIVMATLFLGLVFGLTACMDRWFAHEQKAYLIAGTPVVTGNHS